MREARMIFAIAGTAILASSAISGERIPQKAAREQPVIAETMVTAFARFPTIKRSEVAAAARYSGGFDAQEKSWVANYPPNRLSPANPITGIKTHRETNNVR
jgi:hypothetical protein